MELLLTVLLAAALGAIVWLTVTVLKLRQRFGPVISTEDELSRIKSEFERESKRYDASVSQHKRDLNEFENQYLRAKRIFDGLQREISTLEENLDDISFGVYKPHFDFDDPEVYKAHLQTLYEERKQLIRNNQAVICPTDWTVNGSKREGAKMIKQESKLMLRAFNAEVDAAVAKVSWNNVGKMEERIRKTHEATNALGSVMNISVSQKYLELALKELWLTHELEDKKHEAKEEQSRIREQMREEELAQREFERAKKAAEADEARYQKALAAAREEVAKATAGQAEAAKRKLEEMEQRLAEAQAKLQHAVSMAQLTKSGHVYIISNIGSFGEDVFKIGMTRRLEPTERVDELGSASVPFPYDIHAMIYAEDAPALENAFHRQFHERRVNQVNTRKEFFRVSLDELEKFARNHDAQIEFTQLAEAREYRETIARLRSDAHQPEEDEALMRFPSSLFSP